MHENSCRVCLSSDQNTLSELFLDDDHESTATRVMFCTGVQVDRDDKLPQKICSPCLEHISVACEIKRKCVESDTLLRQQVKEKDEVLLIDFETNEIIYADLVIFDVKRSDDENKDEDSNLTESQLKAVAKTKVPVKDDNVRSESKIEDFRCFFCDKVFERIIYKINHIKQEHPSEFTCTICKEKKRTVMAAEKCIKDHLCAHDYLCQICAKTFRLKRHLTSHQTRYHIAKAIHEPFTCDHCGLKTKYKANIVRHISSAHVKTSHSKNRFPCPESECPDIVYATREGLNVHMYRKHDLKAPVNCSLCKLGFTYNSELKIHRKSCGGDSRKPRQNAQNFKVYCEVVPEGFKCKVCQKVLARKKSWSFHFSANHRSNRKCDVCSKEFSNRTNLYRHITQTHKKIKKFHCDYPDCGKSFGQKQALGNHVNVHTGEKPFACDFCSFRSGDTTTVIKHKKRMHNKKD